MGPTGMYNAGFPAIPTVALPAGYTVAAASSSDYYVNVSTTYGYGWGYGCGWGWGGMFGWGGWGGCGWYGAYYYDYYGYYGFGYGYLGYYEFGGGWGSSLSEPPQLALPAGFWNLAGQAAAVVNHDDPRASALTSLLIDVGLDAQPVVNQEFTVPGGTIGSGNRAYDPAEVGNMLDAQDPEVGAYWRSRGILRRGPTVERQQDSENAGASTIEQAGGRAAVPQPVPKAAQQVQITVAEGQSSHDIAQHIIGQARGTTAAGEDTASQSESQSPAPESKPRQEFKRFVEVRSPLGNKGPGALREKDLTALDRAKAYLSGLRAADAAEFRRAFVEIATNIHEAQTVKFHELPEFGVGFLEGFFVDGAAGNVTGLYYAAKTAVSLWWLWKTEYSPSALVSRVLTGDDFSTEQQYVAKAKEFATIAYQVTQVIGTELGEQAYAHYHALSQGTAEELRALGDTHQQLAMVMLGVAVEVSEELKNISPELKGRIVGAITWVAAGGRKWWRWVGEGSPESGWIAKS